jgi:S-adenosylmethionine/arginine decarboxylase-like enzyme
MASHHFIGTGLVSEQLAAAAADTGRLVRRVGYIVADCGLLVIADRAVRFDNGGLTLVWVLAESHLVLHHWAEEGFATLDLHVCDYHESNARKARRLVERLRSFCFESGSDRWHELEVEDPRPVAADPS